MGCFLARRLLLEMFNMWPESVPFRDVADLNFETYLAVIKVSGKLRILELYYFSQYRYVYWLLAPLLGLKRERVNFLLQQQH